MIAQLTQTGPQAPKYRIMKGDANEVLLLIGATLFWAAVLPIASAFLALAVLWDRTRVLLRRGQPAPWGGVLRQFQLDQIRRGIRPRMQTFREDRWL